MARITVEDCLENVDSRFSLVLIAAERARRLERGVNETTLPRENDKNTVIALREIAEGLVDETIFQQKFEELIEEEAAAMFSPEATLTVPPAIPAPAAEDSAVESDVEGSVSAETASEDTTSEELAAEDSAVESDVEESASAETASEDASSGDAPAQDVAASDTSGAHTTSED